MTPAAYRKAVTEIVYAPLGYCRDGTCLHCNYAPTWAYDLVAYEDWIRGLPVDETESDDDDRMFLLFCVEAQKQERVTPRSRR